MLFGGHVQVPIYQADHNQGFSPEVLASTRDLASESGSSRQLAAALNRAIAVGSNDGAADFERQVRRGKHLWGLLEDVGPTAPLLAVVYAEAEDTYQGRHASVVVDTWGRNGDGLSAGKLVLELVNLTFVVEDEDPNDPMQGIPVAETTQIRDFRADSVIPEGGCDFRLYKLVTEIGALDGSQGMITSLQRHAVADYRIC